MRTLSCLHSTRRRNAGRTYTLYEHPFDGLGRRLRSVLSCHLAPCLPARSRTLVRMQDALERAGQLPRPELSPRQRDTDTKPTGPPRVVRLIMRVRHNDHRLTGGSRFRQRADSALVHHGAAACEQEIVWRPGHRHDLIVAIGDIAVATGHKDGPQPKLTDCRRAHLIEMPWRIDSGCPKREYHRGITCSQKVDEVRE